MKTDDWRFLLAHVSSLLLQMPTRFCTWETSNSTRRQTIVKAHCPLPTTFSSSPKVAASFVCFRLVQSMQTMALCEGVRRCTGFKFLIPGFANLLDHSSCSSGSLLTEEGWLCSGTSGKTTMQRPWLGWDHPWRLPRTACDYRNYRNVSF